MPSTSHISDSISLGAVSRIIPPLEGELNLQHGKAMIIKALDLLQLRKYIESSVPCPHIIFRQTCAIFDKYGSYDGARLYKRLMNIRRPDYENMKLYFLEIRRLRSRMIEIGQCDDAFILEQVFDNLQSVRPTCSAGCSASLKKGDLGFDELVEAMLEWERNNGVNTSLSATPVPTVPIPNTRRGSVAEGLMRALSSREREFHVRRIFSTASTHDTMIGVGNRR